jgi:hypothetical protein
VKLALCKKFQMHRHHRKIPTILLLLEQIHNCMPKLRTKRRRTKKSYLLRRQRFNKSRLALRKSISPLPSQRLPSTQNPHNQLLLVATRQ